MTYEIAIESNVAIAVVVYPLQIVSMCVRFDRLPRYIEQGTQRTGRSRAQTPLPCRRRVAYGFAHGHRAYAFNTGAAQQLQQQSFSLIVEIVCENHIVRRERRECPPARIARRSF